MLDFLSRPVLTTGQALLILVLVVLYLFVYFHERKTYNPNNKKDSR